MNQARCQRRRSRRAREEDATGELIVSAVRGQVREAIAAGRAPLLEAILRRGFLAFDDAGVACLARGSHPADIDELERLASRFEGVTVRRVATKDRVAEVRAEENHALAVADAIVELPRHQMRGLTATGTGRGGPVTWPIYRTTRHGAKLPVVGGRHGSLDHGVALLVKALPIARVATDCSCDGHGLGPMRISFASVWDAAWARAVVTAAAPAASAGWAWTTDTVTMSPKAGLDTIETMLDDAQRIARSLLDETLSQLVGECRAAVLASFGPGRVGPSYEEFASAAHEAVRRLRPP